MYFFGDTLEIVDDCNIPNNKNEISLNEINSSYTKSLVKAFGTMMDAAEIPVRQRGKLVENKDGLPSWEATLDELGSFVRINDDYIFHFPEYSTSSQIGMEHVSNLFIQRPFTRTSISMANFNFNDNINDILMPFFSPFWKGHPNSTDPCIIQTEAPIATWSERHWSQLLAQQLKILLQDTHLVSHVANNHNFFHYLKKELGLPMYSPAYWVHGVPDIVLSPVKDDGTPLLIGVDKSNPESDDLVLNVGQIEGCKNSLLMDGAKKNVSFTHHMPRKCGQLCCALYIQLLSTLLQRISNKTPNLEQSITAYGLVVGLQNGSYVCQMTYEDGTFQYSVGALPFTHATPVNLWYHINVLLELIK